jgi:transposase InsO family protein
MTDNGFAYTKNRSLRELLTGRGIRHLTTKPYRPPTNGKVERFHQTMAREWAYRLTYRSHHQRNQALPYWLNHYNQARPHSSIGDRPPISRWPRASRPRLSATSCPPTDAGWDRASSTAGPFRRRT